MKCNAARKGERRAILAVADDRVTSLGELHSNLMLSTRFRIHFDQRDVLATVERAILESRQLCIRTCLARGVHFSMPLVFAEIMLQDAARGRRGSFDAG